MRTTLLLQASQVEYFGKALAALGVEHEDLVVLDSDVSASTKTSYFSEKFPDRFFQLGISEQDMICIASGLAASGKKPVACGFAIFTAGRAWEQITNSIARPNLNVKIVGTHSGLSSYADGDSHQSFADVAIMRVLPNLKVVVPADAPETVEALKALVEWSGPAYLRLGRGTSPVVYNESCEFSLGEAKILRDGSDATIIANGVMVSRAKIASEQLARKGFDVKVVDMHTVKPLDVHSVEKAADETGAIVTAEEHSIIGGLGGAVAEILSEFKPTPMMRVGIRDRFGESSRNYNELLYSLGLTSEAIAEAVLTVVKRKK